MALGPVRIRIPFLVRTLTALAILFLLLLLFSFSIFLHFLPSRLSSLPFLQSDVPRMAKTAADSLAALLAEKPKRQTKRSRSAVEPKPNTWRAIRVGLLWLWLQSIFSRDGLRFVVRESFKVNFVLSFSLFLFLFSFSFFICEFFMCVQFAACRVVARCSRCRFCASFAVIIKVQQEQPKKKEKKQKEKEELKKCVH